MNEVTYKIFSLLMEYIFLPVLLFIFIGTCISVPFIACNHVKNSSSTDGKVK